MYHITHKLCQVKSVFWAARTCGKLYHIKFHGLVSHFDRGEIRDIADTHTHSHTSMKMRGGGVQHQRVHALMVYPWESFTLCRRGWFAWEMLLCVWVWTLVFALPRRAARNFPAVCDSCVRDERFRKKNTRKKKRNESKKVRNERQEDCRADRD